MQESPLTGGERAFGGGALEYMMLVSMNFVYIYIYIYTLSAGPCIYIPVRSLRRGRDVLHEQL